MGFFRRRRSETPAEPAPAAATPGREAAPDEPPRPVDPYAGTYPADQVPGLWTRTMARPSSYDAVVTVDVSGVGGDRALFVALPEGDLLVETEQGDASLAPFADAVEREVPRPYRAEALREDGDLWAVGVWRLEVLALPDCAGDWVELIVRDGGRELRVDGETSDAAVPELDRAGAKHGADYAVEAERLDGDLFEVRASAL